MAPSLFIRDDRACAVEVASALACRSAWDVVGAEDWRSNPQPTVPYRIIVAPLAVVAPLLRDAAASVPVLPYGPPERMEHAFLLSARDYLCVPFSRSEVLVRSRRLVCAVDEVGLGHVVVRGGVTRVLTGPQRLLWELFCRFPGRVIDRGAIVEHLRGENLSSVDSRAPDMAVCRLRRALRDTGVTIETVRRRGYRLIVKMSDSSPSERV